MMDPVHVAQICHEANRAYCMTLGDRSQEPWATAPDWQRTSAIKGVLAIMDDPRMAPSRLHQLWILQKETDGWAYGPVKDEKLKTHPCMVAYDLLPEAQRRKDALFGAVVRAFL